MPSTDCPCLRGFLAAAQDESDPRYVILWDKLGLGAAPLRVTLPEFLWLEMFDGERTLRDIQAEAMRQAGGRILPLELFAALVERLEKALFLDGPSFRARLANPIREPSCIGCYKAEPSGLRRQLEGLFTGRAGPGTPLEKKPDGKLRAALVPHIDFGRGGATFAWGFKEIFERTDAALFVIIGTSHYSAQRYTLTRKHFRTPLGVVPTDQAYIDRLVAHYGDGLFDDELAHLPEHSIELEVVLLQYLYEGRRSIRIVPLVVGSFQDCIAAECPPESQDDIRRMIDALRKVEAETKEPICYVISGDLAHIGPKFADPEPVSDELLSHSKNQDQAILCHAEAADPAGYFRIVADEVDARRICGLPPTYTLLEAIRPGKGKLLHYDRYVHPKRYESVSFASMAFYQ